MYPTSQYYVRVVLNNLVNSLNFTINEISTSWTLTRWGCAFEMQEIINMAPKLKLYVSNDNLKCYDRQQ